MKTIKIILAILLIPFAIFFFFLSNINLKLKNKYGRYIVVYNELFLKDMKHYVICDDGTNVNALYLEGSNINLFKKFIFKFSAKRFIKINKIDKCPQIPRSNKRIYGVLKIDDVVRKLNQKDDWEYWLKIEERKNKLNRLECI